MAETLMCLEVLDEEEAARRQVWAEAMTHALRQ